MVSDWSWTCSGDKNLRHFSMTQLFGRKVLHWYLKYFDGICYVTVVITSLESAGPRSFSHYAIPRGRRILRVALEWRQPSLISLSNRSSTWGGWSILEPKRERFLFSQVSMDLTYSFLWMGRGMSGASERRIAIFSRSANERGMRKRINGRDFCDQIPVLRNILFPFVEFEFWGKTVYRMIAPRHIAQLAYSAMVIRHGTVE